MVVRYRIKTLLAVTAVVVIVLSVVEFRDEIPTRTVNVSEILTSSLVTLDLGEGDGQGYLLRVSGVVSGRVAIETDSDRMIVGPGEFDEFFNESGNDRFACVNIQPEAKQQGKLTIAYQRTKGVGSKKSSEESANENASQDKCIGR